MIKALIKYIFILFITILIAIIASFVFKQGQEAFSIIKKNKIAKNYIKSLTTDVGFYPNLCPDTAIKYAKKYNIALKDIYTLGGIPDGRIQSKNKTESIIQLDKFGFRNNNKVWESSTINTLILGDTTAFGEDVSDHKLFSNIMNENHGSVVNLSCGGNGLLNSLTLLIHVLESYTVNNILFFINMENDLPKDIEAEVSSGLYKSYIQNKDFKSIFDNKDLYKKNVNELAINIIKAEINYNKNKLNIKTLFSFNNMQNFWDNLYNKLLFNFSNKKLPEKKLSIIDMHSETAIFSESFDYYRQFLKNINRVSNFYNKNITFVIIPSSYRINAPDINIARTPIKYNIVRNDVLTNIAIYSYKIEYINAKAKISELAYGPYILDLTNFILKKNKEEIIFDGHFNERGHEVLADILLTNIKTNQSNLNRKILFYNSLNVHNFATHVSYTGFNESTILNDSQYLDWLKTVIDYFNNNLYDEHLLAPILSYSFYKNKCDAIIDIFDVFSVSVDDERLVLFYKGLCGLKDNAIKIETSTEKIKKSLNLHVIDIEPFLSEAIISKLGELDEIK